jgi:hypothetical protein
VLFFAVETLHLDLHVLPCHIGVVIINPENERKYCHIFAAEKDPRVSLIALPGRKMRSTLTDMCPCGHTPTQVEKLAQEIADEITFHKMRQLEAQAEAPSSAQSAEAANTSNISSSSNTGNLSLGSLTQTMSPAAVELQASVQGTHVLCHFTFFFFFIIIFFFFFFSPTIRHSQPFSRRCRALLCGHPGGLAEAVGAPVRGRSGRYRGPLQGQARHMCNRR